MKILGSIQRDFFLFIKLPYIEIIYKKIEVNQALIISDIQYYWQFFKSLATLVLTLEEIYNS